MGKVNSTDGFTSALLHAVQHYLERIDHLLERVSKEPNPAGLLETRLAPDAFDTGLHFAIAIQFAARTTCPPAGRPVPDIPEPPTLADLIDYRRDVSTCLASITPADLVASVSHVAGKAELKQDVADYITRFAFPNMLFHLSQAYAGLRQAGMVIGKADFDGDCTRTDEQMRGIKASISGSSPADRVMHRTWDGSVDRIHHADRRWVSSR